MSINPEETYGLREIINAKDAEIKRLRDALLHADQFIDSIREDLHSQRTADWYSEGAHNAASAMSESMRLIGNRCADYDAILAALSDKDETK